MNIFSVFALFAFVFYAFLGYYTLKKDSKALLNRVFFVLCVIFAIWAFAYIFFYSAADRATAFFWYHLSAVGWTFFPAISLHFFLVLTEKRNILSKWWLYAVLYLPASAFLVKSLTSTLLVQDFVQCGSSWCEVAPEGSIWFWGYVSYYTVFILGELIIAGQWALISDSVRRKKQIAVIIAAACPALLLSIVTDTIMPASGIYAMPSVAVLLILVWVFGIWYSMYRYSFMTITPSIAVDEIISHMVDVLVLLSPDGRIIKINQQAEHILQYAEQEMSERHFSEFIYDKDRCINALAALSLNCECCETYDDEFIAKSGLKIPMRLSFSPIRDNCSEPIGFVVVGHDVRQMKQLQQEITQREIIQETLLAAESKFRGLVEQSLVGIYIVQNNRLKYVNPKFAEIFGYSRQEILQDKTMLDLVSEDSMVDVSANLVECSDKTAKDIHYSFRGRRRDGQLIEIEANGLCTEYNGMPAVIGTVLDVTQRKQMEETIRYQAYHDPLTGLPNRLLFNDRLTLAIANAHRNNQLLAVLFLDLDYFKTINDTLGHSVGDQLLREVAGLIKERVREGDTVSRMGGDEYTILLNNISDPDDATRIAKEILAAIDRRWDICEHSFYVSASMGVSIYPADGETSDMLLKNADAAMYHVKEQGRNSYHFYSPAMNVKAFEQMMLENNLRHALQRSEFELHYQPQFEIPEKKIVGVEALLRWNHPERGLMYPKQFLQLAEKTGLIIQIGDWVLSNACRQYTLWEKNGFNNIRIAVNISTSQLRQKDFVYKVQDMLAATGMPPHMLELEITEHMAMLNIDTILSNLNRLSDMGILISIDDFGTGYSSLSYLKRLPIHHLKIDQSFIKDLAEDSNDASIAHAVIMIAKSLNLQTIAEGVETEDQLRFLQRSKCDKVQGFLYSKPLTTDELEARFLSQLF
ncbi:MAG: EAL domain-containing protein [Dissulfurispiraceae bacterium]|jgi:diguanylate cyclase (GGDEF)-like protein/PAS domain S-box-containing protein|nr:EAL domain-containing protein [Dissulfurispiraceae bacterium]